MSSMINYYNECIASSFSDEEKYNDSKIKWTSSLEAKASKKQPIRFQNGQVVNALYRPFCKTNAYWDEQVIHRPGIWKKCFPKGYKNVVLLMPGKTSRFFGCLVSDTLPDLNNI
jgi:predicted helicase